jgi:hypothetical protein
MSELLQGLESLRKRIRDDLAIMDNIIAKVSNEEIDTQEMK